MCGFAGIVDPDFPAITPQVRSTLGRMTATLRPRGPDGEGTFFAPGIALGHQRLAVLDLSPSGAQPMTDASGTLHLVHNGEIYNFLDLRAELLGRGHQFRGRSDSEVLLAAYAEWGDAVVDHIEGMFAFAIWDEPRRRLFAARDRMGKKPLYFAQVERPGAAPLFAFASECKALLAAGLDRRLDHEALAQYLVHEYVPPPRTIFAGIRKLDAGERLVLDVARDPRARPDVARYWDLPLVDRHADLDPAGAAEDLWTLLRRSVERRLCADVPVGILLSGGIDSSAVAAAAVSLTGRDQIASFSIGFSDPTFDESAHARAVAQHLGTRHHEERLDAAGMLQLLPAVERILDEPLADASIIPTTLLARFARAHVKVALGGDGGDELFAGYPTFTADPIARWLLHPLAAPIAGAARRLTAALPASSDYFSLDFRLHQLLRGGPTPGPIRHQRWLASFVPEELPALLGDRVRDFDPLAELGRLADRWQRFHPADRLLAFYARRYLAGDVNVKVDRAAGAAGLEVRAPLLDGDLVRFACLVPPRLRHRHATGKILLKRALRGRLPDGILDRKKQGFAVPVARWLRQELRPLLNDELAPDRLRQQGIFDPATVQTLIDDHQQSRRDRRKQLWTLLSFQRWWATWGGPEASALT